MEEDGNWEYDGYNLDLTLFSSGLTISADSDGDMDVSGDGQLISFELFTSNDKEFDSGDYTYSSTEPYSVKTFDYSVFSISYSDKNVESGWIGIKSGTVSISKSNNEYSITINCTSEDGESVTGFYKGSLQYFDYTVKTKSASLASTKKSKRKK